MQNGKLMPPNHVIGEKAVRFIQSNVLPPEWVTRPMHPDYGIDLDVELFDYEGGNCITLGEHLFLQIKGTEHLRRGILTMKDTKINVIKYQLEVSELNLVERMGSAVPVLLILVDVATGTTYHLCLNDYIRKVLPNINPKYKEQQTVVINIPIGNQISSGNIDALRWYGKRAKIYSMFHEMLADIGDFGYLDNDELVAFGKQFVKHYREYDVLQSSDLWGGLKQMKAMLDDMYENDCVLEEAASFTQHALGYTDNWERGEVFEDPFSDYGVNAYLYAQKFSIHHMGDRIKTCSATFESCCREWFVPGLLLGTHN